MHYLFKSRNIPKIPSKIGYILLNLCDFLNKIWTNPRNSGISYWKLYSWALNMVWRSAQSEVLNDLNQVASKGAVWEMPVLFRSYNGMVPYCHITTLLCHVKDRTTLSILQCRVNPSYPNPIVGLSQLGLAFIKLWPTVLSWPIFAQCYSRSVPTQLGLRKIIVV